MPLACLLLLWAGWVVFPDWLACWMVW